MQFLKDPIKSYHLPTPYSNESSKLSTANSRHLLEYHGLGFITIQGDLT